MLENPVQTRRLDYSVGAALMLAAFILYTFTLAPTVLEADGGEFQFVPWLPGITHPTGYPLYTLLGWLWTHLLPVGEVAWRMNLLSAVFAALAVGVTYAVARRIADQTLPGTPLPARILVALLAAGTLAVSHTFWSQALIAEVYTLHAFFVAVILWLTLKAGISCRTGRQCLNSTWAKLLTFTFSLSFLTHHRTTVVLLPAIIVYLMASTRRETRTVTDAPPVNKFKTIATHGILLIAPVLLNLYLPFIAPLTPYATLHLSDTQTLVLYDNSVAGFINHMLATVFSGELQPTAVGAARFQLVWQLLLQQVGWIGMILALAGLAILWQRKQFDLLVLTGLGGLGFVLFNLIYFIGDVFVLFIPVWLIVCLWIGAGGLGLSHWLAQKFVQAKIGPPETRPVFGVMEQRLGRNMYGLLVIGLTGLLLLVMLIPLTFRNAEVSQRHHTTARERWQKILAQPIPQNAVLLSNDRNEIMPLWYYQYVEQQRPDLFGLFPLIVTDPAYANVGRVLDQALASGRPVYLIKPMAELNLKAKLQPAGELVQAIAYTNPPSHAAAVNLPEVTLPDGATESIKITGYDISSEPVRAGQEITITLYWQPVQPLSIDYTSFVHLINADGQGVAQSDHRPGSVFYPSRYWQPNEILRDTHTLTLPPDISDGVYGLRAGMYYQPEPGVIAGMGGGEEIGSLVVTSE